MNQPTQLFFCLVLMIATLILHITPKSLSTLIQVLLLGPMSWTFQEYMAHRFLLHGALFQQTHLGHHKHPSAMEKIFIPMQITAVFAIINFIFFYRIMGINGALNNLASSIFCYIAFEWTHWQAHKNRGGFCEFHIMHHRASMYNYGFTCATWDIVFCTCDPKFERKTLLLLIPFPVLPLIINHYYI